MTTPATSRTRPLADTDREVRPAGSRGDETKPSWKSTELFVYLAAAIAVLIASQPHQGYRFPHRFPCPLT
jgi:hypothetical protein